MIRKPRTAKYHRQLFIRPDLSPKTPSNEMQQARAKHGRKHFQEFLELGQQYCDEICSMSIEDQNIVIESLEACAKYKVLYIAEYIKLQHLIHYIKVNPKRKEHQRLMLLQRESSTGNKSILKKIKKLVQSSSLIKWFHPNKQRSEKQNDNCQQNQQATNLMDMEFEKDTPKQ